MHLQQEKSYEDMLVILSPHFDDAVFSVSNLLSKKKESIKIMTICGGIPSDDKGVSSWDKRCGFSSGREAVLCRQLEDYNACNKIGVKAEHLTFSDFPYAGEKAHEAIIKELRKNIPIIKELWAPIGIGNNPDHLSCRNAALELCQQEGVTLNLYADLPYASARGWDTPDEQREKPFQWQDVFKFICNKGFSLTSLNVNRLNDKEMHKKLEAVCCYTSQLEPLKAYYPKLTDTDGELSIEAIWRCSYASKNRKLYE